VHVSDVHLTARPLGWRRADWISKRVTSWLNLRVLGRGFRFRHADEVVAALMAQVRENPPDRVIFSGDATALGFEAEMVRAARLLGALEPEPLPGLAVPGNHDYCTLASVAGGLFERYFAAWQQGERVEGAVYPFAQRVGPVWLVGVNSATPNFWPWDASGAVGADQLRRLETLLARLDGGPRILVTHYPVYVASGKSERRSHALRDLADLLAVARKGGVGLWLHGHRHNAYRHPRTNLAPFPVVCAGSTTQQGLWSCAEYTVEGYQLRGIRRCFDLVKGAFVDAEAFELELAGG
jgi:3',5'-cyclic AMP phosphodiesterase CpdA